MKKAMFLSAVLLASLSTIAFAKDSSKRPDVEIVSVYSVDGNIEIKNADDLDKIAKIGKYATNKDQFVVVDRTEHDTVSVDSAVITFPKGLSDKEKFNLALEIAKKIADQSSKLSVTQKNIARSFLENAKLK